MADYEVDCPITIIALPAPGGSITDYTLIPDVTQVPGSSIRAAGDKGHIKAAFKLMNNGAPITSPLSHGDKVKFKFYSGPFQGNAVEIKEVTRPPNYAFSWTRAHGTGTDKGTVTLTGVVRSANSIDPGGDDFEYTIDLEINGQKYTIDPDFETDVSEQ